MCGQKLKHSLRNIGALLLVLFFLSLVSLSANPLDELTQILQSYEKITTSLQDRFTTLENSSDSLSISLVSTKSSLDVLEKTSQMQTQSLNAQRMLLKEANLTLQDSQKRTKSLETGYKNMENQLQIYKGLNKILIGVVSVLALGVVVLYVLP